MTMFCLRASSLGPNLFAEFEPYSGTYQELFVDNRIIWMATIFPFVSSVTFQSISLFDSEE
jgi:hypothetical protein